MYYVYYIYTIYTLYILYIAPSSCQPPLWPGQLELALALALVEEGLFKDARCLSSALFFVCSDEFTHPFGSVLGGPDEGISVPLPGRRPEHRSKKHGFLSQNLTSATVRRSTATTAPPNMSSELPLSPPPPRVAATPNQIPTLATPHQQSPATTTSRAHQLTGYGPSSA